ncbi:unnamed protein product [Rhodiola kirilowii]
MKDNKQQKNSVDDQFRKGLWSVEEDKMLLDYVNTHGKSHWNRVSKKTGLKRSGKSCRLRWMNYLSPSVKRESFTEDEEDLIIRLHNLLGNRWALIAGRVPGRTDNQVKNYWNTHLSKKHLSKNNLNSASAKCTPAIIHDGKLKSCCKDQNHLEDQVISSEFSSNTTCGTKASSAVPLVTANKEVEETDTGQRSTQLGALQGNQPGEFVQGETAAADDHGSCFMQYLDDYTLHFVLNNNKRNVAAAAAEGM